MLMSSIVYLVLIGKYLKYFNYSCKIFRFKRGGSSSPDIKKKMHFASSSNEAMGCEDDDDFNTDELFVGIKEEKLFNDSFANAIILNSKNYQNNQNNDELAQNSVLDSTNTNSLKGKYVKNISFSYWNWDNWVEIFNERYEKV